jgi:hypothetical protein
MRWTCIWEVLGLNLDQDTSYPDWDFSLWFFSVFPEKCQDSIPVRPWLLPSESSPIHCRPIVCYLMLYRLEILTAKKIKKRVCKSVKVMKSRILHSEAKYCCLNLTFFDDVITHWLRLFFWSLSIIQVYLKPPRLGSRLGYVIIWTQTWFESRCTKGPNKIVPPPHLMTEVDLLSEIL